jgi:Flp pilus assembly pilin Flp
MTTFFAFLKDDSGATAIEYGLLAAGISIVIIAVEYRCVSLGPYFWGFSAVFGTPKASEYHRVFLSLGPELGPSLRRPL